MIIEERLRAAYEQVFPLFMVAKARADMLSRRTSGVTDPAAMVGGVNAVGHSRALSGPATREITTPNSDTLYSTAWLDLSAGPVRVRVPRIASRYWSVALMDPWTNNFAVLGNRADGEGPVDAWVVGPDAADPRGSRDVPRNARLIRAPASDVWALARWLVTSPADLPLVHAIQDGFVVDAATTPPPSAPRPTPTSPADAGSFLAVVNDLLARNPPPERERPTLAPARDIGLGAGLRWADLPDALQAAWRETAKREYAAAVGGGQARPAARIGGWNRSHAAMGDFGTHFDVRARVALTGLAALPASEVVYFSRVSDDADAPLEGSKRYRIRMPAGGLACDAFWSLTIYQIEPDGRRFLVDNPIGRYLVSDRTPGLACRDDGSFDIVIATDAPAAATARANWLPAPPGRFLLALRAYHPRPELLTDTASLPGLERDGEDTGLAR